MWKRAALTLFVRRLNVAARREPQDLAAIALTRLDSPAYIAGTATAAAAALRSSRGTRVTFMLRHPRGLGRYVALLMALPTIDVPLSDSSAGRCLLQQLAGQSWRRSGSHAVLALPDTCAAYLRGRSRQAVRTNLRKAATAGLTCTRGVPESPEDFRRCGELGGVSRTGVSFVQVWRVADRTGRTAGGAYAVVDQDVAVLRTLYASGDAAMSHQVRFLVHTEMVRDLMQQGTRLLLTESVLASPSGLKYFAARLGYRACRIRVVSAAPAAASVVDLDVARAVGAGRVAGELDLRGSRSRDRQPA